MLDDVCDGLGELVERDGLGLGDSDRGLSEVPLGDRVGDSLCTGVTVLVPELLPEPEPDRATWSGSGRTSRYRANVPRKNAVSSTVEIRNRPITAYPSPARYRLRRSP